MNITTTTVYAVDHEGIDYEFRYNGSLTVNVYVGVNGEFVEADVFTLSTAGDENVRTAIAEYLASE